MLASSPLSPHTTHGDTLTSTPGPQSMPLPAPSSSAAAATTTGAGVLAGDGAPFLRLGFLTRTRTSSATLGGAACEGCVCVCVCVGGRRTGGGHMRRGGASPSSCWGFTRPPSRSAVATYLDARLVRRVRGGGHAVDGGSGRHFGASASSSFFFGLAAARPPGLPLALSRTLGGGGTTPPSAGRPAPHASRPRPSRPAMLHASH